MNSEYIIVPTDPVSVKKQHRVFQATVFSKGLAAFLFISLPFLGGYIGYSRGISETSELMLKSSREHSDVPILGEAASSNDTSSLQNYLNYAKTTELPLGSRAHTQLKEDIMFFYKKDIEARGGLNPLHPGRMFIDVTLIAIDKLFVKSSFTTADDHVNFTYSLVKYNPGTGATEILRDLDEYKTYYYGMPSVWTIPSSNSLQAVLIQIEDTQNSVNSPNTIALYNFLTGEKKILYTETDPGVMLATLCEAGCVGPLQAIGTKVLFCRYQKIPQSTDTELIECKELMIPE